MTFTKCIKTHCVIEEAYCRVFRSMHNWQCSQHIAKSFFFLSFSWQKVHYVTALVDLTGYKWFFGDIKVPLVFLKLDTDAFACIMVPLVLHQFFVHTYELNILFHEMNFSVVHLGNHTFAINTEIPVRFLKTMQVYFEEWFKQFFYIKRIHTGGVPYICRPLFKWMLCCSGRSHDNPILHDAQNCIHPPLFPLSWQSVIILAIEQLAGMCPFAVEYPLSSDRLVPHV